MLHHYSTCRHCVSNERTWYSRWLKKFHHAFFVYFSNFFLIFFFFRFFFIVSFSSSTAHLSNFSITNLDKFNVTKLEFQPLKLFFEVEFMFSELLIDSVYNVSAKLMNFDERSLFNGSMMFTARSKYGNPEVIGFIFLINSFMFLRDVGVHGRLKLNLINRIYPNITDLMLNISLQELKVRALTWKNLLNHVTTTFVG